MGTKAAEAIEIPFDDLPTYLRIHHSVYMDVDGATYYLTDANDLYWRVQRTDVLNGKGHYTDCSELVPLVSEFITLPFNEKGESIVQVFDRATFYASEKPEA